jgi:hypothetical protein
MLGFILEIRAHMTSYSKIVFGSMRMHPERQGLKNWVNLLINASSLGVLRIHCSDEYENFPFLLTVLNEVRRSSPRIDFRFIVKLAEPHFGDNIFDAKKLLNRIDAYRQALQTDQLESIQWMWRGKIDDETGRIKNFSESADQMLDVVDLVKHNGKIKSFHCFPYTFEFAKLALENPLIDGLTIYRNPLELEYDPLLSRAHDIGKRILVIRPFKAGEVLENIGVSKLIKFSASLPVVDGIVVSCSSIKHLEECAQAAILC